MRLRSTLLLALLFVGLPGTAHARPDQTTLFEAPRELLGGDADLRERTLDEIRALGARRVRVVLYWRDVAPDADARSVPDFDERDPAAYDWSKYDGAIRGAHARGLRVLVTLSGPVPRWATRDRDDHVTRPSAVRFGRFAEAAARRYADVVRFWSIWNEPNHPQFLRPQWTRTRGGGRDATSARLYRQLLRLGERGIRRGGNPGDVVLMGETAPRGTGSVVHPITFLRRTLCLDVRWRKRRDCARVRANGYAHHAYTTRQGPWFRPPNRNDVTIGVLSRLNRALARAARAGAIRRGMPIWLTEFGIQSRPDPFLGVSQTAQAEFRAISERIAHRNRRVAVFSQYLMRDDEPTRAADGTRSYDGFESGLRDHRGRAKRSYSGFRLPLVAALGRRTTTLWGMVRPARGRTTVSVDVRRRGASRWRFLKRVRTNGRGQWTARTRRDSRLRYRVRWTAPDGTRFTGPLTRSYRNP